MASLIAALGALWIVVIVWDAFEAIVLPRRVTRRLRPTRMFYRVSWFVWSAAGRRMPGGGRRETYLSFFGPLSLIVLLGAWAASLVLAFAMLQTGLGAPLNVDAGGRSFVHHVYLSGTTFFTLGLGDVTPTSSIGRLLIVIEAGLGFGFLALVIGYLPVLYQSFSRREVDITLLDARAGSPPSAEQLLRGCWSDRDELLSLLRQWERWSAEVLESQLSYPVLSYYRSQHDNQSWLAALTTILDAATLVSVGGDDASARQARLTFAMARHAVVDLAQVLGRPPAVGTPDRLAAPDFERLRSSLAASGIHLAVTQGSLDKVTELRGMYEPYLEALSAHLLMPLPPWRAGGVAHENWRTSAWGRGRGRAGDVHDED
jgi:Ion channel